MNASTAPGVPLSPPVNMRIGAVTPRSRTPPPQEIEAGGLLHVDSSRSPARHLAVGRCRGLQLPLIPYEPVIFRGLLHSLYLSFYHSDAWLGE
jgi:hypothetical protein